MMNEDEYRKQAIDYLEEYGFTKEDIGMLYSDKKMTGEQIKHFVSYLVDGINRQAIEFIINGDFSELQCDELKRGFLGGLTVEFAQQQISNDMKAINIRRMVNLYLSELKTSEDEELSSVVAKIGNVAEHIEADRKEFKDVCDDINSALTNRDEEIKKLREQVTKQSEGDDVVVELIEKENKLLEAQNKELAANLKEANKKIGILRDEQLLLIKEKTQLEIKVEGLVTEKKQLIKEKESTLENYDLRNSQKGNDPNLDVIESSEKKTGIKKFINKIAGKSENIEVPETEQGRKLLLIRMMKERNFEPNQMREITKAYERKIDFNVIVKIVQDDFNIEQMQEVFSLLDAGRIDKEVLEQPAST